MLRSLVLIVLFTGTARADGFYFAESFGGVDVEDELGTWVDSAARIRAALGMRRGSWALEGWIAANINAGTSAAAREGGPYIDDPFPTQLTTYGLDLKMIQPVSKHVELYLRGSVSRGFTTGELDDYAGRGLGIGAGLQVKGKVPILTLVFWPFVFTNIGPKMTGALWVDTGYDFYRLHGEQRSIDAQLNSLTVGFAVGSDF